jgi:hypothetical protein
LTDVRDRQWPPLGDRATRRGREFAAAQYRARFYQQEKAEKLRRAAARQLRDRLVRRGLYPP